MKIKLLCNGGYKGFTRDLEADPIVVDAVKCDSSAGGYRVKVDDLVKAGVYDLDYGLSVGPVFVADIKAGDETMFFFEWEVQANIKPRKVRLLNNGDPCHNTVDSIPDELDDEGRKVLHFRD